MDLALFHVKREFEHIMVSIPNLCLLFHLKALQDERWYKDTREAQTTLTQMHSPILLPSFIRRVTFNVIILQSENTELCKICH